AATTTTVVEPAADLVVGLGASSDRAADGHNFAYTVTVTNKGPSNETGLTVTDSLPAGVAFVSATSDQGVTPSVTGGVVTLVLTALDIGAVATLTITVDPTAAPGAILTDVAAVAGQLADPVSTNNSATLDVPVRGISDLGLSATVQPGSVYQGQNVTYTITAT